MTIIEELCKYLELYLFELRHSRMYPPRYRKESHMIKLCMEHVNAICHAELFVDGAMGKVPEPRMRHQLENDMLRLAELKLHIIQNLADPPELFKEKPGA